MKFSTISKGIRKHPRALKLALAVGLALGASVGVIDPALVAMGGAAVLSTSALNSQGVTIHVSEGSPTNWLAINEVSSINGPSGSASIIDTTDLNSTAKEKVMGLMDEGQVSLDMNYLPDNSTHEVLRAARAAKTLMAFKITFTDSAPATVFYFSAYVTGFSTSAAVDAVLKASVTLEITGAVRKDVP